jgi:hypothetical protein
MLLNIIFSITGLVIFIIFGSKVLYEFGFKYHPSIPIGFGEFRVDHENQSLATKTYNVSSQGQIGGITAGEVNIVKIKFSETQSIKVLPPSLGGNDTLNLDNVATLKLYGPSYSTTAVTLLLDVVPIELPDKIDGNLQMEGAYTYNHLSAVKYTFDTAKNRRHEITTAGRTFAVTLQKIILLDVPGVSNALEYQFGISETN